MNINLVNTADVYEKMILSKGAKVLENEIVRKTSKKKLETKSFFNQKHMSEKMLKKYLKAKEDQRKKMFEKEEQSEDIYAQEKQNTLKGNKKTRSQRIITKKSVLKRNKKTKKNKKYGLFEAFYSGKKSKRRNRSRVKLKSNKKNLVHLLGPELVEMIPKNENQSSKDISPLDSSRSFLSPRFLEIRNFTNSKKSQAFLSKKENLKSQNELMRLSQKNKYKGNFFKEIRNEKVQKIKENRKLRSSRLGRGYLPVLSRSNLKKQNKQHINYETKNNLFGF